MTLLDSLDAVVRRPGPNDPPLNAAERWLLTVVRYIEGVVRTKGEKVDIVTVSSESPRPSPDHVLYEGVWSHKDLGPEVPEFHQFSRIVRDTWPSILLAEYAVRRIAFDKAVKARRKWEIAENLPGPLEEEGGAAEPTEEEQLEADISDLVGKIKSEPEIANMENKDVLELLNKLTLQQAGLQNVVAQLAETMAANQVQAQTTQLTTQTLMRELATQQTTHVQRVTDVVERQSGAAAADAARRAAKPDPLPTLNQKTFPSIEMANTDYELFANYLMWKETCEQIIACNSFDTKLPLLNLLNGIMSCIKGDARKLLHEFRYNDVITLNEFFTRIGGFFTNMNVQAQANAYFLRCVQGANEDLKLYILRLKTLYRASVTADEYRDKDLITQFLRGMADQRLATQLQTDKAGLPKTFQELVDLAINATSQKNVAYQNTEIHKDLMRQNTLVKGMNLAPLPTSGKAMPLLPDRAGVQASAPSKSGGKPTANKPQQKKGVNAVDEKSNSGGEKKGQGGNPQRKNGQGGQNANNVQKKQKKIYCYQCGIENHTKPNCKASPEVIQAYQAQKAQKAAASGNNNPKAAKPTENKPASVHNIYEDDDPFGWDGCNTVLPQCF